MLDVKPLDKYTDKLEREFFNELNKIYKLSQEEIDKMIAYAYSKWGEDGILAMVEAQKYGRLDSLLEKADEQIIIMNKTKRSAILATLSTVYLTNYYNMGKSIEVFADVGISFDLINKNAIKQALLTPFDNIALDQNDISVRFGIKRAIVDGITNGKSVPQMSRAVKDALQNNGNDATRIVRTEVTGIMNKARLDASKKAESEGIKLLKVWVATLDDRTRDRHVEINGETVPLDRPFSNGLMQPGEQKGDPVNFINCRCSMSTEIVVIPESMKDRPLLEIPKEYRI
jgi:SPP1 gp7 family putative phage head morphogenesis protein